MSDRDDDLRERAQRWIDADVDPKAQDELRAILRERELSKTDLADRFAGALEFGTAGLRGILGAGPNRMNRAVVLRTTHGLARYLLEKVEDARSRGVVVGFDGRHLSRQLAEDTACVLAANGIRAHLFDDLGPTPLTAFAVRELGAAGGVMVTASHNPKDYNGYKVYWGNGAQIIPPLDAGIAAAIEAAPPARQVPRMPVTSARAEKLVVPVASAMVESYLARVRALSLHPPSERGKDMAIVYTPMHGVGGKLARLTFDRAGFRRVAFVAEQADPDPEFPTVAFPNPEEKGAMDLSFALARATKADLVLANDPDADRLAVAVPARGGEPASPGGYVQLTGNEVGVLLGHYVLTQGKEQGEQGPDRAVIASIVSSPLLGVIARALGVHFDETLTGFKWIANRAIELEGEGKRFAFGYEEALGYTVGDVVRDKDGVSAAVLMAEMAAWLRDAGRTVLDELDAIHRRYGVFVSSQVNVTRAGAAGADEIRGIMSRLRAEKPRTIGDRAVAVIRDYETRTETRLGEGRDGKTAPLGLPPSNVLAFELEGGSRIIARPSGTEPKIKYYFDVREAVGEGEDVRAAEARARGVLKELERAFLLVAGG
jgi:phosphomannomutase